MTFFMHEMMSPGTETQDEPQAFFRLRLIFFVKFLLKNLVGMKIMLIFAPV